MKRIARFGIVVLTAVMLIGCTDPVLSPETKRIDNFPEWVKDITWNIEMTIYSSTSPEDKIVLGETEGKLPPELSDIQAMGFSSNAEGYGHATDTSYDANVSERITIEDKQAHNVEFFYINVVVNLKKENCSTGTIKTIIKKDKDSTESFVVIINLKEIQ